MVKINRVTIRKRVLIAFLVANCFSVIAQDNIKSNHIKANKLNNKSLNVVFQGQNRKESYKIAIKLLDSAIALDPGFKVLYSNKFQDLCAIKDYEGALKVNGKLLKLYPSTPEIILGRGLVFHKLGMDNKAAQYFKQSYTIYTKQYAQTYSLSVLENLAFNKYLLFNRDSAYVLLNREKFRFQKRLKTQNQLDLFLARIFPTLTKDNAL